MLEKTLKKWVGKVLPSLSFAALFYGCRDFGDVAEVRGETVSEVEDRLSVIVNNSDLNAGDKMNVSFYLQNPSSQDSLTARYYMVNSEQKIVENNKVNQNKFVYVGRRDFFSEDTVNGFFEYNPSLETSFKKGSAQINPYSGKDYESDAFDFLITVSDKDNKMVAHKFWGERDDDPYLKKIKSDDFVLKFNKYLAKKGRNQTHVYAQDINRAMDKDILEMADYIMPHLWDAQGSGLEGIVGRVGEYKMKECVKIAHEGGVKVLPMFSSFYKDYIDEIVSAPESYAQSLVSKVKGIGADGIVLDLESIKLREKDSRGITNFVRDVRFAFDELSKMDKKKYEVGVAVSPRFEGSEKFYRHHAGHDIEEISKYANKVLPMGHDFNVDVLGPNISEKNLKKVVSYMKKEVDDDSKIVVALPGYGRVYDWSGKEIGPISEKSNSLYLGRPHSEKYLDGELYIEVKDFPKRKIYTQDPKVHQNRLKVLSEMGIENVATWKASHLSDESIQVYDSWNDE